MVAVVLVVIRVLKVMVVVVVIDNFFLIFCIFHLSGTNFVFHCASPIFSILEFNKWNQYQQWGYTFFYTIYTDLHASLSVIYTCDEFVLSEQLRLTTKYSSFGGHLSLIGSNFICIEPHYLAMIQSMVTVCHAHFKSIFIQVSQCFPYAPGA